MSGSDSAPPAEAIVSRRHPHRQSPVRMWRVLALASTAVLLGVGCTGSTSEGPVRSAAPTLSQVPEPPPTSAPTSGTQAPEPPPTVGTVPAAIGDVAADEVQPVQLRVASIGVEAEVVPVGVDVDGDMEVPSPEVAGWYRFGPAPGEQGMSVLAAHVDFDGRPGAFFRLRELEVGDRVEVSMSDGSVQLLSVTRLSQVAKTDLADAGVFERSGSPSVALITCGGEFDRSRRSYEDNVVAFAEPVG